MVVSEKQSVKSTEIKSNLEEYRFLSAGEWLTGTPYTVLCPYDAEPVALVHRAGPDDLERAIDASVRAFAVTRKLPAHRRAAILRGIAEMIGSRAEELARTIALEAGKPIKQARLEVSRAA